MMWWDPWMPPPERMKAAKRSSRLQSILFSFRDLEDWAFWISNPTTPKHLGSSIWRVRLVCHHLHCCQSHGDLIHQPFSLALLLALVLCYPGDPETNSSRDINQCKCKKTNWWSDLEVAKWSWVDRATSNGIKNFKDSLIHSGKQS